MTTWVGLLRGINVGKAKRLPMADLKRLVEGAGYTDARTLLNSGNVVFRGEAGAPERIAARLERAVEETAGFHATVVVLSSDTLATVVAENALASLVDDPARLLVAFVQDASRLEAVRPLAARAWEGATLAVGSKAAYAWCPGGILESGALEAMGRLLKDQVTTRNWATVQKLAALAGCG
ncbi:hypothetical protein TBR22_A39760 [Luteitalea sp. TBR-22]|uniref:DUF1697 domain-containing protein n=1 Tax=Luteitalea sp. TBR-22 TaxID=2802971 RepID=UPI001AF62668|nr:DUF1697 domain-containing protein [Luteitalea sp. TBR-22]BCS34750.1 hypothetical protein TBR22_A39760 [Luteitalea sp. TBR-22]